MEVRRASLYAVHDASQVVKGPCEGPDDLLSSPSRTQSLRERTDQRCPIITQDARMPSAQRHQRCEHHVKLPCEVYTRIL
jgi:hypothetical protein